MSTESRKDVRRIYRQQVLSGFRHLIQPSHKDSDSPSDEQRGTQELPPEFWQQREYQVSISVIIETLSPGSHEYKYQICINDDTDILITPTSKRRKKVPKQIATIHQETITKTRKIPMVYGIHEEKKRTLSYPDGFSIGQGITEFYSFLLGQIDRAIEHIVQQQKNQKGNDDARERTKSSPSQENVGDDKKTGRGSKVRTKVRTKAIPENTAKVDETNWSLLGGGSPNFNDRLDEMGDDPNLGNALEGLSLDF